MSALERLGRAVAKGAGSLPPPDLRERVRSRVLTLEAGTAAVHLRWWRPAMAVALLLLATAGGWQAFGRADALAASAAGRQLMEGAWLTAAAKVPLDVSFEDRGHIKLAAQARGRLSRLSRSQVELALEDGLVDVDVKPKSGTAWTIAAGPYRVEVLGTAFAARWNVARSELEVRVVRGVVRVIGGSLEEHGVQLRAGDNLVASARNGQALISRTGPLSDGLAAPVASPAPAIAHEESAPEPTPSTPASAASSSLAPEGGEPAQRTRSVASLRELGQQARYADVMARAEELGFESLTRSLAVSDLALLADAARYQKQVARARSALLMLRQRFPGTAEAATATFLLGRLAADQGHDYAAAAKWFAIYSQEHPNGPMAAEALGRRAQLLALSGDHEGARAAASQYLQHYPSGPYAAVARGLRDGRSLKADP